MKNLILLIILSFLFTMQAISQCGAWEVITIPDSILNDLPEKYRHNVKEVETMHITNYYQRMKLRLKDTFVNIDKRINYSHRSAYKHVFFTPTREIDSYDTITFWGLPHVRKNIERGRLVKQAVYTNYLPIEKQDTLQYYFSDTSISDNVLCQEKLELSYIFQNIGLEPIATINDSTVRIVSKPTNGSRELLFIFEIRLLDNEVFIKSFFLERRAGNYEVVKSNSVYLPKKYVKKLRAKLPNIMYDENVVYFSPLNTWNIFWESNFGENDCNFVCTNRVVKALEDEFRYDEFGNDEFGSDLTNLNKKQIRDIMKFPQTFGVYILKGLFNTKKP
jgi:hypothetical protein